VWNWNSLLLKPTSGVAKPASDAGIFLTECWVARHQHRARNGKTCGKPSSCSHDISCHSDIELKMEQGSGSAPHY
jgi:hypothetical protein